jgi:hypothetical protein
MPPGICVSQEAWAEGLRRLPRAVLTPITSTDFRGAETAGVLADFLVELRGCSIGGKDL